MAMLIKYDKKTGRTMAVPEHPQKVKGKKKKFRKMTNKEWKEFLSSSKTPKEYEKEMKEIMKLYK